jgi:hypothetical protein
MKIDDYILETYIKTLTNKVEVILISYNFDYKYIYVVYKESNIDQYLRHYGILVAAYEKFLLDLRIGKLNQLKSKINEN